jgi:hypothetical protein
VIWTPDEEWEKKSQKELKKRQIEYEKLKTEKEIKNCAKLIDEKLNEGKQYFLEVLKKKNTIYANDVENYLKESGGKLGHNEFYPKNHPPQSGKIGDLQSQPLKDFGVWFHNDKLEHFSFRLKTKHLPKKFSLEISGSDYYGSFRAEYFSDKNKFSVNTGDPWPFMGLLGSLAKKLNDELAKIPRYQDDPIPF